MSSTTVKRYGLALKRSAGSLNPADYLQRETAEELEEFAGRDSWDSTIVELDITITFPEPELPTTTGSVISAVVDAETRTTLALDEDGDWHDLDGDDVGGYYSNNNLLTGIKVLFDAATIK